MLPTLAPGDRLLVDRSAYRRGVPEPGDIVVLRDPEGTAELRVKRIAPAPAGARAGTVWVLGDRPEESRDSRAYGAVPTDLLVGRAWYRYAPRSREGPL